MHNTLADDPVPPPSSSRNKRVVTRPQIPAFASATSSGSGSVSQSKAPRPGTRSVRALGAEQADADGDDPATIPPESMREDPSTLPPDNQKTPLDGTDFSALRGPRNGQRNGAPSRAPQRRSAQRLTTPPPALGLSP